jgi:ATP-dependent Clp protease ATP-binding subunit ClpA
LGGRSITTEHLLLGLFHSRLLESLISPGRTMKELRREAEGAAGSGEAKLPTSAELPLAEPAKMALTYAEEESNRLESKDIDVPHLLLGLMRTGDSKAAKLLSEFGLNVDDVRLKFARETVLPGQEPFGGVVCAFYGMEIRFDVTVEGSPRIIAAYQGQLAAIEIDPVKVIQSHLPARAESMVLEWMALRKDEIIAAWRAGKAGKRTPPIKPLE